MIFLSLLILFLTGCAKPSYQSIVRENERYAFTSNTGNMIYVIQTREYTGNSVRTLKSVEVSKDEWENSIDKVEKIRSSIPISK